MGYFWWQRKWGQKVFLQLFDPSSINTDMEGLRTRVITPRTCCFVFLKLYTVSYPNWSRPSKCWGTTFYHLAFPSLLFIAEPPMNVLWMGKFMYSLFAVDCTSDNTQDNVTNALIYIYIAIPYSTHTICCYLLYGKGQAPDSIVCMR